MEDMLKLDFWEIMLRTTLTFIVLLILARFMGKKQISQLTFFHYVTGITIGSIAANIASESKLPFLDGLVAMIWWALLTILTNFISFKSKKARVLFDDKPVIIIRDGKLMKDSMEKTRLHLNDLNMLLREQNIFSIQDVHYAVLETNGQLSVMMKSDQETATKKDVKAHAPPPKFIPTEIISDYKLIPENLKELNLTEDWVHEQLKKQGIGNINQVFYAEVQSDGKLHVDLGDG